MFIKDSGMTKHRKQCNITSMATIFVSQENTANWMRSLYINTTVSLSFVMKTENNIEQRICTLPSGKHTQRKSYLTSCPLKLTIIFSGSLNRTCTGSKTLRRFINFNERAKFTKRKNRFSFCCFLSVAANWASSWSLSEWFESRDQQISLRFI